MLREFTEHDSAQSGEASDISGEAGFGTTEKRTCCRLVLSDSCRFSVQDYIKAAGSLMADQRCESGSTYDRLPTETDFQTSTLNSEASPDEIVVFMEGSVSPASLRFLSQLRRLGQRHSPRCLIVITSLRTHLSANPDETLEQTLLSQLKPHFTALTVIRTGLILSPDSAVTRWARRLRIAHPLISPVLSGTFLPIERLVSIIETELKLQRVQNDCTPLTVAWGARMLTVPGRRRLLSDVVAEITSPTETISSRIVQFVFQTAATLGVRSLIAEFVRLLGQISTSCRQLTCATLYPQSAEELRQLCNRHSTEDIQIAGCNNGVRHFGWKFPSKTVVVTTSLEGGAKLLEEPSGESPGVAPPNGPASSICQKPVRRFRVDAGLTLKYCIDELARSGYQFFVVPNYSYISMGTLFFVPVHGSGSRVSTLGDTIESVTLWNCRTEQHVTVRRGDELFCQVMYSPAGHWLVQSLTLVVRSRTSYTVRRETLQHATAEEILRILNDAEASNVEIRRSSASSTSIDVCRYYAQEHAACSFPEPVSGTFAAPQDRIGRVWDRLEETPIFSSLFHWFVRTYAFHVELFLTSEEFRTFWEHLHTLPVSKIQLRRVLKDGMPHSACQHEDRVSADLFMTQGNRDAFCRFIERYIPNARTNPGKQSF